MQIRTQRTLKKLLMNLVQSSLRNDERFTGDIDIQMTKR